jgi:hypothetical protein
MTITLLLAWLLLSCGFCFVPHVKSYSFSVVVLPDTQEYSKRYPEIFENQTSWIIENKRSLNVVFVSHLGDVVGDWNCEKQWNVANNSMRVLEGKIAWGIVAGNHDGNNGNWAFYNKYFGDKGLFSYQNFMCQGNLFMSMHLSWGANQTAVLALANQTIRTFKPYKVMLTLHGYLSQRGNFDFPMIWEAFVRPNADRIFLVLCGHAPAEAYRLDVVNRNKVYSLLANYQSRDNGGNGFLRILQFDPVGRTIHVKTFSPYLNQFETDSDSELDLVF